jgi:hypothetical protein
MRRKIDAGSFLNEEEKEKISESISDSQKWRSELDDQ